MVRTEKGTEVKSTRLNIVAHKIFSWEKETYPVGEVERWIRKKWWKRREKITEVEEDPLNEAIEKELEKILKNIVIIIFHPKPLYSYLKRLDIDIKIGPAEVMIIEFKEHFISLTIPGKIRKIFRKRI